MKAVILAGGLGSRLAEETESRPKPMVMIGNRPILWHIMKYLASEGINDFVICLGYKGYVIKEYFANYFLHSADLTLDIGQNTVEFHNRASEPWRVTLVNTGETTGTAGRLRKIRPYLSEGESFLMTYGDGLANIDIQELLKHHRKNSRLVTVSAVRPPGRYGSLVLQDDSVIAFEEKPPGDGAWISGGYFAIQPDVFDRIGEPISSWEVEVLPSLARDGQLSAFRHDGFWGAMDTLRDKKNLEELWFAGNAPWKNWR